VSQKQRFNEVVDAEYAIFMNPALTKNSPIPAHSDTYTKAMAEGILKIEALEDWKDRYTFAVHPLYVTTINEKGFVIIGTDLVQFTPNTYKVMHGGTATDCEALNAIKVTSGNTTVYTRSTNGLEVRDIQQSSKGITADVRLDYTKCWGNSKTWTDGNKKAYMWVGCESEFVDKRNAANQVTGLYSLRNNGFVYVQNSDKDFWGNFVYRNCDMYISSSWKFKSPWNTIYTVNDYIGGTGTAQDQAVLLSSFSPQISNGLNTSASNADISNYFDGGQWLSVSDITPANLGLTGNTFPYPKAIRPTLNANGIYTGAGVYWQYACTGGFNNNNYQSWTPAACTP
jgi:hypothetical protein